MRTRMIVTTTLGGFLVAAQVFAQPRPDFTGIWIVETVERPERPSAGGSAGGRAGRGGGSGGMRGGRMGRGPERAPERGGRFGMMSTPEKGQRIRIKQVADRLIVTTPVEGGEEMSTYALDGSESTNVSGRGTAKSRTKWDGAALVTETSRKVEAPMGEMTLKTREVRRLSDDRTKLIVRTTVETPRGRMTTTVTYAQATEES